MGILELVQEARRRPSPGNVEQVERPQTIEVDSNIHLSQPIVSTPNARRANNEYTRRESQRFVIRQLDATPRTKEEIQGDTGANCTATNQLDILWNVKWLQNPIPVATYSTDTSGDHACYAVAVGIIKIITDDNTILECQTLYCPQSTGTVLSPHRVMVDDNRVDGFAHEARRKGNGKIIFFDENRRTLATLTMHSKLDGIYLTSNPILVPKTVKAEAMTTDATTETELRLRYAKTSLPPPLSMETTPNHPTTYEQYTQWIRSAKLTPQQFNGELWHQRLGHVGWKTMKKTSEVVEGVPPIPSESSSFHCPFCDMSKQTKRSGRKESQSESFQPGTAFHMDLGFVSGPANLEAVIQKGENPKRTTQKSQDGHVAYLLIIDAATRYTWVFLLKNKQPPIAIIAAFLTQNGKAKQQSQCNRITVSPDGLLSQSIVFNKECEKQNFQVTTAHYELALDQPTYKVTTDNGTELAGSEDFRRKVAEHGYISQTTAPEASNQSGKGERGHRTFKERVRCLLYAAGLGNEFWSHALLHVVWLYNRTYHKAIEDTPYRAWTGRTPTIDGLLTFGCKVTSKKSKKRTSALDPNTSDGIFLGYRPTMDNIVFWNTTTKQRMTTTHFTIDELEYGRHPEERSPASKHLIEAKTGTKHHERRSDKIKEPIIVYDPEHANILADDKGLEHAAAATMRIEKVIRLPPEELATEIRMLELSTQLYEQSVTEYIPLQSAHATLGMVLRQHPDLKNTIQFERCELGTAAAKNITRWRSRLKGAVLRQIGEIPVTTLSDVPRIIAEYRHQKKQRIDVHFAHPNWSATNGDGIPMLHFDQLNVIAHHLHHITTGEDPWKNHTDRTLWPDITDESIDIAINKGIAIPTLTRRKAQQQQNWSKFLSSEWTQLDKYDKQGMFGQPCAPPPGATVLPWVWTYIMKIDPLTNEKVEKARGTCNGGPRYGKVVTLAETYAACLEQPAHRLAWALSAALNHVVCGCDVGNAFAEAEGPDKLFYMQVDPQFQQWWTEHLGKAPIQERWVIPILKNLQGHPEAPRLWSRHIDRILQDKMGFIPTTHEPCLYYKRIKTTTNAEPPTTHDHGTPLTTVTEEQEETPTYPPKKTDMREELVLLLRQVDDFMISSRLKADALEIQNQIQSFMTNKLNDLGVIKRFNGVDVQQTRNYIKLHCETYIDKIISHHGWENDYVHATRPIPMRSESQYQAELETSQGPQTPKERQELEKQMGFSYRQAIGELIFAMTICRLDISAAVIKLSQYSENPAKCHYQAVRNIFGYLRATKADGIYYWRPEPRDDLPDEPLPTTITPEEILKQFKREQESLDMYGASDATWATDRMHRRSVSGIVFMIAGGAVLYRTRIQPTVALSSTEAELSAMADAGKALLYIRSILEELGLERTEPTDILVDNKGARQLSNAQQPTRRTRHVEMKQFFIMHWTDEGIMTFKDVRSQYNISDSLSKPLGRTKFYEQNDILMGRRRPTYHKILRKLHLQSPPTLQVWGGERDD